jgi:erythronate-4-phosphate dehydrogenase
MGVIGVGNVGTHVIRLMNKLGVSTTAYDPPREQRDPTFSSNSLEELLATDILSFHTPLTRDGAHPTYHWLDTKKLIKQNYELVLNTSRGGVIDEKAVLSAMDQGTIRDIIIDVWEGEPDFNLSTAKKAFIKTPHIAGYSVQAKERASNLAANAMLNHFGINHPELKTKSKPNVLKKEISEFDSLSALLDELHPLGEYETELQKIITNFENERAKYFNKLRAEFPLRQEFPQTYLPASYFKRFPILKAMGFSTAD